MSIMSIMGAQARISSSGMLEAAHIFAVLGRRCPTLPAIFFFFVSISDKYGLQRHLPFFEI